MDRETRRPSRSTGATRPDRSRTTSSTSSSSGSSTGRSSSQRATMFGLGAGTIGALLRSSERPATPAFGATRGRQGRRHAPRRARRYRPAPLEPYLLNDGGTLAFAGIPGEYLTFTNPKAQVSPVARDELEGERRRDRLDVPDPQGRAGSTTARQMTVRRRRRELDEAVRRARARTPASRPFFDAAGCRRAGSTPSCSGSRRRSARSRTSLSQTTYQAIIQPAAIAAQPGSLGEERR